MCGVTLVAKQSASEAEIAVITGMVYNPDFCRRLLSAVNEVCKEIYPSDVPMFVTAFVDNE